jgi:hypothetical protein
MNFQDSPHCVLNANSGVRRGRCCEACKKDPFKIKSPIIQSVFIKEDIMPLPLDIDIRVLRDQPIFVVVETWCDDGIYCDDPNVFVYVDEEAAQNKLRLLIEEDERDGIMSRHGYEGVGGNDYWEVHDTPNHFNAHDSMGTWYNIKVSESAIR